MAKHVGKLVEPFIVGQDPRRKGAIEDQLFKDFSPKDVLEEIWLSDIAVLTAAIEYYRGLEAAVTRQLLIDHGLRALLRLEFSDVEDGKLTYDLVLGSQAFITAAGKFAKIDLERIGAVVELINKMRRERERVYLLFERKRRALVIDAVQAGETLAAAQRGIENLSD
jgi:hypothetical protein